MPYLDYRDYLDYLDYRDYLDCLNYLVQSDSAVHVLLRDPVVRVLHRVALWRPLTSSLAASSSAWAHLGTAGPSLQVTRPVENGEGSSALSF